MTNDNTKRLNDDYLLKALNKILENSINIKVIEYSYDEFDSHTFILKNKPEYKLSIQYYFNKYHLVLHLPNGNVYRSDAYSAYGESEICKMFNKVYDLVDESYKNEDRSLLYNFLK